MRNTATFGKIRFYGGLSAMKGAFKLAKRGSNNNRMEKWRKRKVDSDDRMKWKTVSITYKHNFRE